MMHRCNTIVIIAIVNYYIASIDAQNLEKSRSVWVEQGLVRGRVYKLGDKFMQLFRGKYTYIYEIIYYLSIGIPYAEPPVAELRFRVYSSK